MTLLSRLKSTCPAEGRPFGIRSRPVEVRRNKAVPLRGPAVVRAPSPFRSRPKASIPTARMNLSRRRASHAKRRGSTGLLFRSRPLRVRGGSEKQARCRNIAWIVTGRPRREQTQVPLLPRRKCSHMRMVVYVGSLPSKAAASGIPTLARRPSTAWRRTINGAPGRKADGSAARTAFSQRHQR